MGRPRSCNSSALKVSFSTCLSISASWNAKTKSVRARYPLPFSDNQRWKSCPRALQNRKYPQSIRGDWGALLPWPLTLHKMRYTLPPYFSDNISPSQTYKTYYTIITNGWLGNFHFTLLTVGGHTVSQFFSHHFYFFDFFDVFFTLKSWPNFKNKNNL